MIIWQTCTAGAMGTSNPHLQLLRQLLLNTLHKPKSCLEYSSNTHYQMFDLVYCIAKFHAEPSYLSWFWSLWSCKFSRCHTCDTLETFHQTRTSPTCLCSNPSNHQFQSMDSMILEQANAFARMLIQKHLQCDA